MKVLHLTQSVGRNSGGLGAIALALARQHDLAGHETEIWTNDPADVAGEVGDRENLRIRALPVWGPREWGFSRATHRVTMDAGFDVVHQHGIWTGQSQITNEFRRRGVAAVVAPQGSLEPWSLRRSPLKKRLALLAYESENLRESCLQATAEVEAGSFRRFGLRGPIAVLPNGVENHWLARDVSGAAFRSRIGVGSDERLLLFLSRIHPKKGLPMLIEALATQRHLLSNWRLVIAGADEAGHEQEVRNLVEKVGLSSRVLFVGGVYGQDKREAYAAADLFVLPTHSDNFAIVVTEALASGVPVLTTHGAPWSELVTADAGWWVPASVSGLAGGLAEALELSPEALQLRGKNGVEVVRARYTWEAVAANCVRVYEWLVSGGAAPSFVMR